MHTTLHHMLTTCPGIASPVPAVPVGRLPANSVLAVKFGSSIVKSSTAKVGLPLISVKLLVLVVTAYVMRNELLSADTSHCGQQYEVSHRLPTLLGGETGLFTAKTGQPPCPEILFPPLRS